MRKRVILNIGEGSFERGFPVMIQIGEEGLPPQVAETGHLPALPRLPQDYQCWQTSYEALGQRSRIKVRQITPRSLKEDCQKAAQILQDQFTTWLDSKEFRPIQDIWRETLSPHDEIRVLLQTHDAALQRLPWHLWDIFTRYPKTEIGMSSPAFTRPRSILPKPKVAVLAILGDSDGIDTNADRALLEQIPNADVKFLVEPTRRDLNEQLYRQPWHILFFAGHSESKKGCGRIYLNANESLTFSELANTLRQASESGLQLAILNSCDGFDIARDLADLQIPQIVFMREPVPDPVAQEFLKYFLTAFSQGKSLYLALRTARDRLETLENEFLYATWLPVIYQHPAASPPTWQDLIDYRPQKRRRSLMRAMAASTIATLAVVGMRQTGLLQSLELKMYDQMLQARSLAVPEPRDNRIVVIEIGDQDAIVAQRPTGKAKDGQSISNQSLMDLLDVLEKYQPRAIGLDLYRLKGKPPELIQRFQTMPHVVGACKSMSPVDDPTGKPPPEGLEDPQRVGFTDFVPDEGQDNVLRRQLLFLTQQPGSPCPADYALSARLAFIYLDAAGIQPEFTDDQHLKLGKTVFQTLDATPGPYSPNSVDGGQILLNYRPVKVPSLSLTEVITEQAPLNGITDKIVLIGVTHANSKRDRWFTPFYNSQKLNLEGQPGVFLQAQMVSNILSAVLDGRALLQPAPVWLELVWIAGWAGIGSLLMICIRPSPFRPWVLLVAAVASLGSGFGVFLTGIWLPIVPGLLSLSLAGAGVVLSQTLMRPPIKPFA